MTISELIERLEALKAEHGDLEVAIGFSMSPCDIEDVRLDRDAWGERIFIEAS